MSGRSADEDGERVREITARAIRRLDLLEYAILGAAAVLAIVAGALVAVLVTASTALPWWETWVVASLLLFVLPALGVWWRDRRSSGTGPPSRPGTE